MVSPMATVKWSFSSLKDFVNCPKQYNEVKVKQNFVKKVTEQMMYGTEVHKALEDYVRDGTPLAKNYLRFKPMMDVLRDTPGTHYPEYKMALCGERKPTAFDAPNYWVRGIVDFPDVEYIKGGLLFVAHNSFVPEEYKREEIDSLWRVFESSLSRLSHAFETDSWPANPTPLCGWCPVKTCEFYKER